MVYHSVNKDHMKWIGTWEATKLLGDGSQLTNLPPAGAEVDPVWTAASAAINTHIASNAIHFTEASIDHDVLTNTHNLTTDIDHDSLTNTHNNPYTLDEITDPAGDTTFSFGSNDMTWQFSNPASDGFTIEAIGAYAGDLVHIHQHTGNPGAVNLLALEAVDTDVTPLVIDTSVGEAFKIDHSGNLTLAGTVDGIDIATDVVANTTHIGGDGSDHADVASNTSHAGDSTQAHSDYLKNDAADVGVGLSLTGDQSVASAAHVVNTVYWTGATPPTASNFPIGTIYVQYTP